MKHDHKENQDIDVVHELYEALLLVKTTEEMNRFFKDLCTPQEMRVLAERWRVCKILDKGDSSYREINSMTGASLTTIGRVARFLNEEPHQGYKLVLNRMRKNK